MHSSTILSLLSLAGSSLAAAPQHIFSNPSSSTSLKIPTAYESAVQARRILNLTPLATIATTFPSTTTSDDAATLGQRPPDVAGLPIGLTEYIADCEDGGNPTILGISISTYMRNAAAGSNISLSVQWTPPYPPASRIKSSADPDPRDVGYSAANLPRFALLGYLEEISAEDVVGKGIEECFLAPHPDAKYWVPGNDIHESLWVRLVVQEVYWFGGFGDRAYIGWIPIEDWRSVTKAEWQAVRLPGEKKGWKEWTIDDFINSAWEL